jgi:hypothetical protein
VNALILEVKLFILAVNALKLEVVTKLPVLILVPTFKANEAVVANEADVAIEAVAAYEALKGLLNCSFLIILIITQIYLLLLFHQLIVK